MTKLTFVSVIIPIRNEAMYVERGLLSILAQDYPSTEMEILIADGLSTDNTCQIIRDFATLHPRLKIRVLENPGKTVPIGMNLALRKAEGEIIIRVDGHCIIASDYVRKCVTHIQKDGVDGVGGPIETKGETYIAKAIAIGMSSPFGVGNSAFRTVIGNTMLVDTVPFPAYTREIIEKAGLYDEELVRDQDDEYNYRIRELGGKILLAGDVRSTYFSRASLKGLWWQYFQYGYWKVRVLQKHPRQMSLRQFVPPAFVASLGLALFVALFSPVGVMLLALIAGIYLTANVLASLWTAAKRGWRYLPLLPVVFAILHLSYGAGFLTGLVKFARRWGDKTGKVPPFQSTHA